MQGLTQVGRSDWREQLVRSDGRHLPSHVVVRLRWYEEQVALKRIASQSFQTILIVLSAAIAVAAATGARPGVVAVLGSTVTALLGIGQMFRWTETWGRLSGTLAALQLEVVAWSVGAGAYADEVHADAALSTTVETLVAGESAHLSPLHRRPSRRAAERGGQAVTTQENHGW